MQPQFPEVYTLNGIRKSAFSTTDRVGSKLQYRGVYTKALRYLPAHTWNARWPSFSRRWANILLNQVEPGADIVAHSYGCLLTYHMMNEWHKRGNTEALFKNIFMFAPAMNRSGWNWGDLEFDELTVIAHRKDLAIRLGQINPFHPFGAAGRLGFKTDDVRFVYVEDTSGTPKRLGHSHYFEDPHVNKWVSFIQDRRSTLRP